MRKVLASRIIAWDLKPISISLSSNTILRFKQVLCEKKKYTYRNQEAQKMEISERKPSFMIEIQRLNYAYMCLNSVYVRY